MPSRLIVAIANHPLLGEELVFRDGTCLHKVVLPEPLRYSEDLDYVLCETAVASARSSTPSARSPMVSAWTVRTPMSAPSRKRGCTDPTKSVPGPCASRSRSTPTRPHQPDRIATPPM
ncbi:MAG: nucleotidyl transferase AbiEii/AbiGii toxin family protein [Acidimicrobiia bacterium]|nr:nucleotidyl transferase AbiEii/AbiGii toxin family protein [Acidimicrobiia bacterium]